MAYRSIASCVICILVALPALAEQGNLQSYRDAALAGGDAAAGKAVFHSEAAGCQKCHHADQDVVAAGPDLTAIGDKYSAKQLIREVLEPSSRIHADYAARVITTTSGLAIPGVVHRRTAQKLELLDGTGKLQTIAVTDIEEEQASRTSLMPGGIEKQLSSTQFADLIAYLASRKQPQDAIPGLVETFPKLATPVKLEPFPHPAMTFDHPVWIIHLPTHRDQFLVVEQKTRKVWRVHTQAPQQRELFLDLSSEASTGQFEGLMCLAFHPQFATNRKYYVNFHVRNQGSHFSPIIAERTTTRDYLRDAGGKSRRILQIPQATDLHWGGMLAFGPDNYLYIGAGDAGPQEDPEGHGQDLSLLVGKILRIDVDAATPTRPYGIPASNPLRNRPHVRPEIWAYGFRMPWRFSWDPLTGDLWVGEIGQNLFEEVTIAKKGENHGWNVYEAFTPFSDRFRRPEESYTPPVLAYRRSQGVSVTGGYVYRGSRSPSFHGAYIFGDYESKKIWALTRKDGQLDLVREIGESPQRIASFGIDQTGELFVVGHEGKIFRLVLDDATLK